MDDHGSAALPRAAGDGHVDPGSPFLEQIPQNGSTEVAEDRASTGREDRGQKAAMKREGLATDREHATMYPDQPALPRQVSPA